MRRFYSLGPFGWPEWLRVLVITSFFGPVLLFCALLGYGVVALIGSSLGLYALPVGPELFDSWWGRTLTAIIFFGLAAPLLIAPTAALVWEAWWQWKYRHPHWREERNANRLAKAAKRRARVARPAAGWPVLWSNALCALAFAAMLAVWLSDVWRQRRGMVRASAPTTIVRENPLPASTHFRAK